MNVFNVLLTGYKDYPVRCFFFDFPKDLSFHLDTLRKVNPHRTHHSKRVGSIPIHTWHKKLEKPDVNRI